MLVTDMSSYITVINNHRATLATMIVLNIGLCLITLVTLKTIFVDVSLYVVFQ